MRVFPCLVIVALTVPACGPTAPVDQQPALERGAAGATTGDEGKDDDKDDGKDDGKDDDSNEVSIAIADLPDAVVQALEDAYPGAELIAAEIDRGIYDVDLLTAGGDCIEAEVKDSGEIVGVEQEDAHECK